ncbi:DNA binding protein [Arthrobacter phage Emotion]|uniref:DNA binding protein n=1 Tax=Arthrobacter phage Emotion TaxID=3038361 RepID=A0AA49ESH3_9CAUD|nr:DNA binding protein [Arthrobacter phage Emotion]
MATAINFSDAIADIFDRRAERRFDTVADEQLAIALAQHGDEAAKIKLLYAYAPALRNAAATAAKTGNEDQTREDREDVRMDLIVGFLEAIGKFDPAKHQRLAAVVTPEMKHYLSKAAVRASEFHVPARTVSRVFAILKKAGQDVEAALELVRAGGQDMTPETFLSTLQAIRNVDSMDGGRAEGDEGDSWESMEARALSWDGDTNEVEDRILVEAAFQAVDGVEKEVIELAYGFADYNPLSDPAIGERIGKGKATVQRYRNAGLGKMREALGVA